MRIKIHDSTSTFNTYHVVCSGFSFSKQIKKRKKTRHHKEYQTLLKRLIAYNLLIKSDLSKSAWTRPLCCGPFEIEHSQIICIARVFDLCLSSDTFCEIIIRIYIQNDAKIAQSNTQEFDLHSSLWYVHLFQI